MSRRELRWLAWLAEKKLLETTEGNLAGASKNYQVDAGQTPSAILVPSMTEGSGVDQPVFVRGNPAMVGVMVSRGSLEALLASSDFFKLSLSSLLSSCCLTNSALNSSIVANSSNSSNSSHLKLLF